MAMMVTFDTNIYLSLCGKKHIDKSVEFMQYIKEKENMKKIYSVQNVIVLNEMFKYLVLPKTEDYELCKKGIILSTIHCGEYIRIKESYYDMKSYCFNMFCPDASLMLISWLGSLLGRTKAMVKKGFDEKWFMDFKALEMAHEITSSRDSDLVVKKHAEFIKYIKDNTDYHYEWYAQRLKAIYDFEEVENEWKYHAKGREEVNSLRSSKFSILKLIPELMPYNFLTREEIIEAFPDVIKRIGLIFTKDSLRNCIPDEIVEKFKADFAPFHNILIALHESAIKNPESLYFDGVNIPRSKRWNSVFDALIVLSSLANNCVLITEEGKIIKAYKDANMDHMVMKKEDYFKFLGT